MAKQTKIIFLEELSVLCILLFCLESILISKELYQNNSSKELQCVHFAISDYKFIS